MLRGALIRGLQVIALWAPGASSLRVWLHRMRGVTIGERVFIGSDVILETMRPDLICIGNDVTISMRATVIAHFRGGTPAERGEARYSVEIGDEAFIGPGVIVLEGVTIGRGAVVTAGSVVTSSVAPMTMVRGNPATPVARLEQPLLESTPMKRFLRGMRPIRRGG
jgi:acetyltransferase-like isoleucine patch superfamily enzyme